MRPDPGHRESAVTVGSFDGVHRGHRAVIDLCVQGARATDRRSLIVTFAQHPLSTLAPPHAPALLTTTERKIELLAETGADAIVCLPFDENLAAIEAPDFVGKVLFERLGATLVVCGYDFNFGRGGRGTAETIRTAGLQKGVQVVIVPPQVDDDQPISSTRVREALREGRIREANRLLGRAFDLDGAVVAGDRRGRRLEFPTANLLIGAGVCAPVTGVYAVRARTREDGPWKAMMNIGRAPTFGLGENRLEVHLFDFEGDLYGKRLRAEFVERMREERRFESAEALVEQLKRDREMALKIHAESEKS